MVKKIKFDVANIVNFVRKSSECSKNTTHSDDLRTKIKIF
jgi:hypothetical protein